MHILISGHHFIGQIQSGPRVTTIHQDCHLYIPLHWLYQNLEHVVIDNVSTCPEIHRNQCLIIAIIFDDQRGNHKQLVAYFYQHDVSFLMDKTHTFVSVIITELPTVPLTLT